MKKIIAVAGLALIAVIATAQNQTIYLKSQTVTCYKKDGIPQQCLEYNYSTSDSYWLRYSGTIKGFTYQPGYFYTLLVKVLHNKAQQWQLIKIISKTKSTQQHQITDTLVKLLQPPAELVGRWSFTRLPAEANPVIFTKEFLVFDPTEMRVNGKASCNGFFGNYTADTSGSEKEIHFEAIGHTMMACDNLSTENKMLKAMEKVTTWNREGDKLYLKAGTVTLFELTREAIGVI